MEFASTCVYAVTKMMPRREYFPQSNTLLICVTFPGKLVICVPFLVLIPKSFHKHFLIGFEMVFSLFIEKAHFVCFLFVCLIVFC